MKFLVAILLVCVAFSGFAQEKRGKPILKDWESTYYYSYFGKYYYGYHNGIGAADLGVEIGPKGWGLDLQHGSITGMVPAWDSRLATRANLACRSFSPMR